MMRQVIFYLVMVFLLLPATVMAQLKPVTGTVTTAEGEPLPGVTIVRVGTMEGTVTDLDGKFIISALAGDELQFSFVGYADQVVPVQFDTPLMVKLAIQDELLDEVVVVGYGLQKKESVVASIVQTTGEDIERTGGVPSLSNALTGLLPGVITVQTTGEPGADAANIFIRGKSTWVDGGGPLVLVDGVRTDMNNVDPTEVQSISVLKDASATAVFGVEGANGVILISTKRGTLGKPKMSFSGNTRIKTLSRIPEYLNSYEALKLRNEAVAYEANISDRYWDYYKPVEELEYYRSQEYPELYPDVNWSDYMIEDYALSYKFNFNVAGGTDFVKYFATVAYLHDGDIIKTHDYGQGYDPDFSYDRFNFRTNLDFALTSTTAFKVNLSGYHGRKQEMKKNASTKFWQGVYGAPPDLYPVQYSDGWFGYNEFYQDAVNPVAELNFGGYERTNTTEVIADFDLTQKLDFVTKGLSVNGKLAYNTRYETRGIDLDDAGVYTKYIDPSILNAQNADDSAAAIYIRPPYEATSDQSGYDYSVTPITVSSEQSYDAGNNTLKGLDVYRNLMYQVSLNYAREFGQHSLSLLGLWKREEYANQNAFLTRKQDWVYRLTYNYDTRYFIETNGAYNGSDKFGPEYRMEFFPSASAGWMISNEKFFKDNLPWWNVFKLKFSYGLVGDDKGVPSHADKDAWSRGGSGNLGYPSFDPNTYTFWKESTIGNPDLHWATAEKQNLATELAFFKNMVSFSFDYFWEYRYDIFMKEDQRTVLDWFGADPVATNLGETKTHGYEMALKLKKTMANGLHLWFDGNYNYAEDEIIYFEDAANKPDYQKAAGFQIDQTRVKLVDDMNQNWNDVYTSPLGVGEDKAYVMPSDFRYIDFNADGVIDLDDVVPYGYPSRPQNTYSLSLGAEYKGVSAMIQFYGAHNVSRSIRTPEFQGGYSVAQPFHRDDSWTPETAGTASYPHVRYRADADYGSYWIKDASYIRLKTVELAYSFSFEAMKAIGISNARIYANGNNLFLWTKMLEDREGGSYENNNYPMTRSFNLGLSLNF